MPGCDNIQQQFCHNTTVHLYSSKLFFKENDFIYELIKVFGYEDACLLIMNKQRRLGRVTTFCKFLGISATNTASISRRLPQFIYIPSRSQLQKVRRVSNVLAAEENGISRSDTCVLNNISYRTACRYVAEARDGKYPLVVDLAFFRASHGRG